MGMIKIDFTLNDCHFEPHLVFFNSAQDFWGLSVCYFTHITTLILKNPACYQTFPGFVLFLSNTLSLGRTTVDMTRWQLQRSREHDYHEAYSKPMLT